MSLFTLRSADRRPMRLAWPTLFNRGPLLSRVANGVAVAALVGYVVYFSVAGAHAGDAHAYWAADVRSPYTTGVNESDAYLYSPAFLLAISPLKLLPWEAFFVVFTALNIAILAWLVGPVLAVLVLLPGPYSPVWVNLWYGNIGIPMAAALVLVFRWPGAWSFLLLTKVTPIVGIAWFAARREWRHVRDAALITGAIVIVSALVTPSAWGDWIAHLSRSAAQPELFPLPPLWLRLIGGVLLAAVGGLLSARWAVPLAALLAQPVFWFTGFTMLIAWLGLVRHRSALNNAQTRRTSPMDEAS